MVLHLQHPGREVSHLAQFPSSCERLLLEVERIPQPLDQTRWQMCLIGLDAKTKAGRRAYNSGNFVQVHIIMRPEIP